MFTEKATYMWVTPRLPSSTHLTVVESAPGAQVCNIDGRWTYGTEK